MRYPKLILKLGMIVVSAVRLPGADYDGKRILSIEDGFRAAIDPNSFKILKLFGLEGGEITLPERQR